MARATRCEPLHRRTHNTCFRSAGLNNISPRNRLAGSHHPDPMISKRPVGARQVNLLHVAAHAFVVTRGAGRRRAGGGLYGVSFGQVAGKAFRVVEAHVAFQSIMRVMTGDTTDSLISPVTGTVKYSIGLVPDVVDAILSRQGEDIFEAAMAGAAKFL
jgi:hypothetical protein